MVKKLSWSATRAEEEPKQNIFKNKTLLCLTIKNRWGVEKCEFK
jgi:hypothetical protein